MTITLQTWGPDYPDPHTNASTFAHEPRQLRRGGQHRLPRLAHRLGSGSELHAMTEAAVVEKDADKRAAMYEEIQRKAPRQLAPSS